MQNSPTKSEAMILILRQQGAGVMNAVGQAQTVRCLSGLDRAISQAVDMLTAGIAYLDRHEGRGEDQQPATVHFDRWVELKDTYVWACDIRAAEQVAA